MVRLFPAVLSVLVLPACTFNVPISQFDEGIAELCTAGQHEYQGKPFTLHYGTDQCPANSVACIRGTQIYVREGRQCPADLAHELNHLMGNHWVDRPRGISWDS